MCNFDFNKEIIYLYSHIIGYFYIVDNRPSTAIVPSTPLSLIPFLNKMNEQWTSDLETPQAQPYTNLSAITTTEVIYFLMNYIICCNFYCAKL